MRKSVFLLICILFTLNSNCSPKALNQDKSVTNEEIILVYSANSRGFYKKITFQNQTIYVSNERSEKEMPEIVKVSDADWKQIVKYIKGINLNTVSKLESPTKKRLYDGAAIAGLKITYKGKTYETASFDHGFPPKEIKKLVDRILKITDKKNDN